MPTAPRSPRLTVLCIVCLAATCAAATTEPATRPASIEEVVHFPTISLKTKGLMPADAFSLLAQATGVQIAPAQEISQGADGAARKIDLWHDSLYSKIEFDVESANFWQAMDRLTDQAHLTADGADGSLTLSPDFAGRDSSLDSISDTPLCRARATLQPAIHPEARSNNQPPAATDRRAGMSIISGRVSSEWPRWRCLLRANTRTKARLAVR